MGIRMGISSTTLQLGNGLKARVLLSGNKRLTLVRLCEGGQKAIVIDILLSCAPYIDGRAISGIAWYCRYLLFRLFYHPLILKSYYMVKVIYSFHPFLCSHSRFFSCILSYTSIPLIYTTRRTTPAVLLEVPNVVHSPRSRCLSCPGEPRHHCIL